MFMFRSYITLKVRVWGISDMEHTSISTYITKKGKEKQNKKELLISSHLGTCIHKKCPIKLYGLSHDILILCHEWSGEIEFSSHSSGRVLSI